MNYLNFLLFFSPSQVFQRIYASWVNAYILPWCPAQSSGSSKVCCFIKTVCYDYCYVGYWLLNLTDYQSFLENFKKNMESYLGKLHLYLSFHSGILLLEINSGG